MDLDREIQLLEESLLDDEVATVVSDEAFAALMEDEFIAAFEDGSEPLEEKTIMKLSKKDSLKKAIGLKAIQMSKTQAPSLYAKYKKAINLKNKMEKVIVKKFATKARAEVKKALQNKR